MAGYDRTGMCVAKAKAISLVVTVAQTCSYVGDERNIGSDVALIVVSFD